MTLKNKQYFNNKQEKCTQQQSEKCIEKQDTNFHLSNDQTLKNDNSQNWPVYSEIDTFEHCC